MVVKNILYYRENLYDPKKSRVYKRPTTNFNCTNYFEIINFDKDGFLSEPPFTASIPYEHLLDYIEFDDSPLPDPQIPLHIQGTERFVELLPRVSRRMSIVLMFDFTCRAFLGRGEPAVFHLLDCLICFGVLSIA